MLTLKAVFVCLLSHPSTQRALSRFPGRQYALSDAITLRYSLNAHLFSTSKAAAEIPHVCPEIYETFNKFRPPRFCLHTISMTSTYFMCSVYYIKNQSRAFCAKDRKNINIYFGAIFLSETHY